MTKSEFVKAGLSLLLPLSVIVILVQINRTSNENELTQTSVQSGYEIYLDRSAHEYWAQEVIKGGYILHFRHAERAKWTSVTAFDAVELYQQLDASGESFSSATCLTPHGIQEAKLIGRVFDILAVNVSSVYSSPSCRARQTSLHAFGTEGTIDNSLLHRTAVKSSQHAAFSESLRNLILDIDAPGGSNVVLSGHGGTLGYDGESLIDENRAIGQLDDREEGGFVVLDSKNGKIIAHNVFRTFEDFANEAIELPLSNRDSRRVAGSDL